MRDTVVDLPADPFAATVRVPGDKSLGHRACILAAMANGRSEVRNLSSGADIRSTLGVVSALGVALSGPTIASPGIDRWHSPIAPLDCGNSGTTMRLVTGALAGSQVAATLIGDASLSARPMRRVAEPLRSLDAEIDLTGEGTAPISVAGRPLTGGLVELGLPSAQVRTAVALAALRASDPVTIVSPPGFRDHTERWFIRLGLATRPDDLTLTVVPGDVPPLDLTLPGDPSSAAFLWAAAAVRIGSIVTTPDVSLNPGRMGFLAILRRMGAAVTVTPTGDVLGDPVGDVTVTGAPLRGVTLAGAEVVAAIDELPLLAVVAAAADGITSVEGAAELRAKESDRLTGAVLLARLAGANARLEEDGFVVGQGDRDVAASIDSSGDHRIAMAAAIAGIVRGEPLEVIGFEVCGVSWPGFATVLEALWS